MQRTLKIGKGGIKMADGGGDDKMAEAIQEYIKVNKQGFEETQQVVQAGSASRMKSMFARSQSTIESGQAQDSSSLSREASAMMQ